MVSLQRESIKVVNIDLKAEQSPLFLEVIMFYILKPVNVKRRRRRRIYPKKVDGLPCFSLDLPIIKGIPDWDGVVSDERLLIPTDITSPPQINTYGSKQWSMKIGTLAGENYLKKTNQDLVFYDQKGDYIDLFQNIAPKARNCTVFTSDKRRYENCCNALYKSHGCFIRINSMLGIESGIAITDNEYEFKLPKLKYFSPSFISQNVVRVPPQIKEKLPINASEFALSEALCVDCGIGKPEDYVNLSFYP